LKDKPLSRDIDTNSSTQRNQVRIYL